MSAPTTTELIEILKNISQKEDKTQKLGQNTTYVSIGVLVVILGGAMYIANGLSDMRQDIGELKVQLSGYSDEFKEHKLTGFHETTRQYIDQNFVPRNQYENLAGDVRDLQTNIKNVQDVQQQILLELRSLTDSSR